MNLTEQKQFLHVMTLFAMLERTFVFNPSGTIVQMRLETSRLTERDSALQILHFRLLVAFLCSAKQCTLGFLA